MKVWAGLAGLLALVPAGCVRHRAAPPLAASPHYVLGGPYQVGGAWYYPAESYSLDVTGLASVAAPEPGLTADGEIADPGALTAAMPTIQLPAIAEVTNLENGRQIELRVNDRGPASPARLIALSPRAALLLAVPAAGVARVRVRVEEALSHQVVEQVGGGPKLSIATAPAGEVVSQPLPPAGAGGTAGPSRVIGGQASSSVAAMVPDRMPEIIHSVYPRPGQLWLRAGSFGRFEYANRQAATLGGLGGDVLRSREGRQETYAVRAGPFRTVAEADAALFRALAAGIADARITVEDE